LPIDRPRRIFRHALPRTQGRGLIVVLAICLVAATGVALATLPRHSSGSAQPAAVRAQELEAPAADVAVVDGGTLLLRNQVVRLFGVEPPPRGTACDSVGGSGGDCGAAATNALAAMVRDVSVSCRVVGADTLGRPYAVCQASGTELNRAIVAAGWARTDSDAGAPLKQAEQTARAGHRGLWATEGGAR
jgi:endonuclease YncB( thermonuclease family)